MHVHAPTSARRRAVPALALLAGAALLAVGPSVQAQSTFTLSSSGNLTVNPNNGTPAVTTYSGSPLSMSAIGSLGTSNFVGRDVFFFPYPISANPGITGAEFFNIEADYLSGGTYTSPIGTLKALLTSGSFNTANTDFTGNLNFFGGTGIFAGDTGTGTITLKANNGAYTDTYQATLVPNAANAVPEPGTFALLALGLLPVGLLARTRRRSA